MTLKTDLLSLEKLDSAWHWKREAKLLLLTKVKAAYSIVKDSQIKQLLGEASLIINYLLYSSDKFDLKQEKAKRLNNIIDIIHNKAMTIDETTQKIEAEQTKTNSPKKQGMIRTIVTGAIILASLGMYHPGNVNAAETGIKNGTQSTYVRPGRNVGVDVNKQGNYAVFQNGSNVGVTNDGKVVVTPQRYNPNQTNPYQQIDEAIRKDPTNASLYIQKADAMIQNKAPPQEIINNLKKGREIVKQNLKKKVNKDSEISYNALAVCYDRIGKYQETISIYKELDELFPTHNYKLPIKNIQEKIKS